MSVNFLNPKNWDNVTDEGRNNIVFQNRNHAYGAYVIRRDYNRNLFFALFFSVGIFISAFIVPKVLLNHQKTEKVIIPSIEVITECFFEKPIEKLEKPEIIEPVILKPEKPIATQNNSQLLAKDEKVESSVIPNIEIINPGKTTTPGEIGTPTTEKPNDNGNVLVEKEADIVMFAAEIMPVFPGGDPALLRFLQSNINYPPMARENGIKGTVIVGFVIDITGKPVNLSILKGIRGGKDLEAEAMRVIAAMPNWSVGMNNNKPVSVMFSLPVRFDLRN